MAITFGNPTSTITAQQATAKITLQIADGSADGASLRALLDGFSPAVRLSIAQDVVSTLQGASADSGSELRALASRLKEFGQFVQDGQTAHYFPDTHHAQWMNAANPVETKANLLDGLDPNAGVRTV